MGLLISSCFKSSSHEIGMLLRYCCICVARYRLKCINYYYTTNFTENLANFGRLNSDSLHIELLSMTRIPFTETLRLNHIFLYACNFSCQTIEQLFLHQELTLFSKYWFSLKSSILQMKLTFKFLFILGDWK